MPKPFQDEPFQVQETGYRRFFHIAPVAIKGRIAKGGIKRRSRTRVKRLSPLGNSHIVYFFARKECAEKWGSVMAEVVPFLADGFVVVEFTLPEDTLIAWDNARGMQGYTALRSAEDVLPEQIVSITEGT